MQEILQQQIEKSETFLPKEMSENELEISKEKIEQLPEHQEAPAFYRGLPVKDALNALFGQLELNSKPEKSIRGERDNAAVSDRDAIYYAPTSVDKRGRKFLCAIGLNLLQDGKISPSCIGKLGQIRIDGRVIATEVIIRLSGKKPGSPQKIKFLSPKEFYYWYVENIGAN